MNESLLSNNSLKNRNLLNQLNSRRNSEQRKYDQQRNVIFQDYNGFRSKKISKIKNITIQSPVNEEESGGIRNSDVINNYGDKDSLANISQRKSSNYNDDSLQFNPNSVYYKKVIMQEAQDKSKINNSVTLSFGSKQ